MCNSCPPVNPLSTKQMLEEIVCLEFKVSFLVVGMAFIIFWGQQEGIAPEHLCNSDGLFSDPFNTTIHRDFILSAFFHNSAWHLILASLLFLWGALPVEKALGSFHFLCTLGKLFSLTLIFHLCGAAIIERTNLTSLITGCSFGLVPVFASLYEFGRCSHEPIGPAIWCPPPKALFLYLVKFAILSAVSEVMFETAIVGVFAGNFYARVQQLLSSTQTRPPIASAQQPLQDTEEYSENLDHNAQESLTEVQNSLNLLSKGEDISETSLQILSENSSEFELNESKLDGEDRASSAKREQEYLRASREEDEEWELVDDDESIPNLSFHVEEQYSEFRRRKALHC